MRVVFCFRDTGPFTIWREVEKGEVVRVEGKVRAQVGVRNAGEIAGRRERVPGEHRGDVSVKEGGGEGGVEK